MSLWKFAPDGQRYTLYMSTQDLYDIADAISALLDYLDDEDEDEG
ncbi:MAG: hypothetical protein ACRDQA_02395 [Nocardioidaceae bacterium]